MSNDNSNERINDDVRQRPLIVIPPSVSLSFHYHSNGNDVSAQFLPHLSEYSSSDDDDNDDKMSR